MIVVQGKGSTGRRGKVGRDRQREREGEPCGNRGEELMMAMSLYALTNMQKNFVCVCGPACVCMCSCVCDRVYCEHEYTIFSSLNCQTCQKKEGGRYNVKLRYPNSHTGATVGPFVILRRQNLRLMNSNGRQPCKREAMDFAKEVESAPADLCEEESDAAEAPPREGERDTWGERYVQLLAFTQLHGSSAVEDDVVLGPWVRNQREVFAALRRNSSNGNTLTPALREKEALLDAIMLGGTLARYAAGEEASSTAPEDTDFQLSLRPEDDMAFIGQMVEKEFPGFGTYKGRITGFFVREELESARPANSLSTMVQKYYHVVYEDDDEEDITEEELLQLVAACDQNASIGVRRTGGSEAADKVCRADWSQRWEKSLSALAGHVKQHGHAHVQRGQLSDWAKKIREAYNKGELPADKILQLRSRGFCFDAAIADKLRQVHHSTRASHEDENSAWQRNFESLKRYSGECGHAHPRVLQDDGVRVCPTGVWARDQRLFFKRDLLSPERVLLLRGLDFCFDGKMAELLRSEVEGSQRQREARPAAGLANAAAVSAYPSTSSQVPARAALHVSPLVVSRSLFLSLPLARALVH